MIKTKKSQLNIEQEQATSTEEVVFLCSKIKNYVVVARILAYRLQNYKGIITEMKR
ncbi:MAG: hypothetical protein PWQ12_1504 [Clostridiales bacterium]|jgi:hypothetical protein|nr:hypothetical protein [Clostridiales bacterium]